MPLFGVIPPDLYALAGRLKHESNRQTLQLACHNLEGLLSSDTEQLTSRKYSLTKTELKIATMIKNDMSTYIDTFLPILVNRYAIR